jgi:uncharacterized membrane protein YkgB
MDTTPTTIHSAPVGHRTEKEAIEKLLFTREARLAIPLLFVHMITTAGPLVFLPTESWQAFLVPTLVGQYIIKNLVIIAAAVGIAAHVRPMK